MSDRWQFLTGSEQDLEPVWEFYWVGHVRREPSGSAPAPTAYAIGHGSPVHLLDREGRIRVVFDADFRPAAMAHDLETLLQNNES
jgi:cytochrome oxidase Cu insertion factor (SCO1/SenC/PrrC family)